MHQTDEGSLGRGAYGEVFRAELGILPCAAKVLHKALFDSGDTGANTVLERFKLECDLLFSIRHPNVVQFLDILYEPTSRLPILLMELLDESLTAYLERSKENLPLYLQVNILYDISLAIDYLHSKDIVHRDLSSNNILLLAGHRAKVSDFGLARMIDQNMVACTQNTLSVAPGSVVYMPPEALRYPPVYSYKLDCFSVGPLIIQMSTRLFPNPGPRTKKGISDSNEILISDIDRRMNHISLVPGDHPLLPIAKKCLCRDPDNRPSASEMFHTLLEVKKTASYIENQSSSVCSVCKSKTSTQHMNQQDHNPKESINEATESDASNAQSGIASKNNSVSVSSLKERKLSQAPCGMVLGSVIEDNGIAYFRPAKSRVVYSFNTSMHKWLKLPICPNGGFALAVIDKVLVTVGGFDPSNRDTAVLLSLVSSQGKQVWREDFPRMPSRRSFVATACNQDALVVVGGSYRVKYNLNTIEILDIARNSWYVASDLPFPLSQASVNICGDKLFVIGGFGNSKWIQSTLTCSLIDLVSSSYSADDLFPPQQPSLWETRCDTPALRCTSVVLDNELITVNGKIRDDERTDSIFVYKEEADKWEEIGSTFMPRSGSLVVGLSRRRLLVVGGWMGKEKCDTFEFVQL